MALTPSLGFDQLQSARGRRESNILDLITRRHFRQCNVWFNLLSEAIKGSWVNLPGNLFSTQGRVPLNSLFPWSQFGMLKHHCWLSTWNLSRQEFSDLWMLATAGSQELVCIWRIASRTKKLSFWLLYASSEWFCSPFCFSPSLSLFFFFFFPSIPHHHHPHTLQHDECRRLDWTNRL